MRAEPHHGTGVPRRDPRELPPPPTMGGHSEKKPPVDQAVRLLTPRQLVARSWTSSLQDHETEMSLICM